MKKYRKYIIVFMLLFIYALVAETYSTYATEKNADYKYMNVKKGVTIKKYIGKSKKVIIPEKIDGKTVVGIEKKAFYENKKINMVKMPDTIKYIDYSAFSKCSNLKKVVLSKNLEEIGMYAFKKTAIVSVKIPDKVESLYYATFDKCKKLKSVKLGENVESIDTYCFRNCTNLKDICLENVKRIGSCAFANNKKIKGKLVLKDAVKIEDEAFYGCTSVTEVEFSPSLEVLGREDKREKYANPFAYCTGIEKFVIDNNNANYVSDDGVIYDKAKMWIVAYPAKKKSVADIEENIVGIAKHAFSGADITMLNMKNNLNFIGEEAFAKSDIEEVNMPFPDETKEIKWSGNAFESCKKLRRVIFPEGIKGSYNAAFINCTSLTEVILPESMTHISPEMFLCCESLETVTIPKDVSVIPAACFYGCKSLKNVNLDNIDDIHAIAFYDCDSFTGVLNLNVSKIEYAAFGNCDNITEINLNNIIAGLNVHNKFDFLKDGEFESDFIDSKIYNKFEVDNDDYWTVIGNPFAGCKKLEMINTAEEGELRSVDGILFSSDMSILVSYPAGRAGKYIIPFGVKRVGVSAFEKSSLSEVVCSDSTKIIELYAFAKTDIKKITFSKMTEKLGGNYVEESEVFEGSKNLKAIYVHKANEKYKSINGVLYEKCRGYMYLAVYPAGKKVKIFEVPENSFISEDAFNECVYLKKVYIKNMGGKWAENYDPCQTYFKNCSGIKLYLAENYKPEQVGKWYERVWIRGFDKNCKNCEIYVHKKSPLARMLDKKKIEYDVY